MSRYSKLHFEVPDFVPEREWGEGHFEHHLFSLDSSLWLVHSVV